MHSEWLLIDAEILANSSNRWLKVASVVVWTEKALSDRYPGLSYIFYAFVVEVPELAGCMADGATYEEALNHTHRQRA